MTTSATNSGGGSAVTLVVSGFLLLALVIAIADLVLFPFQADYYIAFSFGISLFATASIFYRFTGSIFNPSVSLALCIVGAVKPLRFIRVYPFVNVTNMRVLRLIATVVAFAQMVGGIVAAAIVDGLTPGELTVNTTLGQGTSRTQGLFIEMFCTSALVLSVLMLAAGESISRESIGGCLIGVLVS